MRVLKYILTLLVLVAAMSCFRENAYDTTLVVVTAQQSESGGDFESLDGSLAYAFVADTNDYKVVNYNDALNGVLTNKSTGEQLSPLAVGEYSQITYEYIFQADEDEDADDEAVEGESDLPQDGDIIVTTFDALTMMVGVESVMLVVVDPTSESYAYTNYKVGLNLATTYITVSFRPWKGKSFAQGTWFFVLPDVEEDGGESEGEATEE